jgi:hypothetical protein
MEIKWFEFLPEITKIILMYFEYKIIKALIDSAKSNNQRLDDVEKKLRNINS